MKPPVNGNPFAHPRYQAHLRTLEVVQRHRRGCGPRAITTLPDTARSFRTFTAPQQAELHALAAANIIEVLSFLGDLFVTFEQLDPYAGPGFDIAGWLRAAQQPAPSEHAPEWLAELRRPHTP